ncbi:hypothetical protein ADL26_08245, partial [Thermoactinomyces vulgaris]
FALGGIVVGAYGPHWALAVNAVTFLASAALLQWGVGPHLPEHDGTGPKRGSGFALAGIKLVVGDRRLFATAGLVWLVGCYVVAEALAAHYRARGGVWAATRCVAEYGRTYSEERLRALQREDPDATWGDVRFTTEEFPLIAKRQNELEEAEARRTGPVL